MTPAAATTLPPSAAAVPPAVLRLVEARAPAVAAQTVGQIRWHARSETEVDTGSWFARAPLHAIVAADRLVLVATGPRPVVVELPLQALGRAIYNHVTGELVFPRMPGQPPVPPLGLDPLVARDLLAFAPAQTDPTPPSGTPSHA
jgi:hypothetical protein